MIELAILMGIWIVAGIVWSLVIVTRRQTVDPRLDIIITAPAAIVIMSGLAFASLLGVTRD